MIYRPINRTFPFSCIKIRISKHLILESGNFIKQDFEKTAKILHTFHCNGLEKIKSGEIRLNKRKLILTFFPPYIYMYVLFISALVKHIRVGSNCVNGVCIVAHVFDGNKEQVDFEKNKVREIKL